MTHVTPQKRGFLVSGRPVEKTATEGNYSELVVAGNGRVTVTLIPLGAGARGRVHYTTSTQERLSNGTAFWQVWEPGEVEQATTAVATGALTAVRAFAVKGTVVIEVCRMGA
jgi:hypothetical protein